MLGHFGGDLNYHQYYPTDVLNGDGIRCVLFVAGCNHGCDGCYNESTWNPNSGERVTEELIDRIITDLKDERIVRKGLTLSGGDPLHARNLPMINHIITRVRIECPDKDIWMWTGYTLEEINENGADVNEGFLRKHVAFRADVLVDGRFVKELHHPGLKWRGSSNQKVYRFVHDEVIDITPNDGRIL